MMHGNYGRNGLIVAASNYFHMCLITTCTRRQMYNYDSGMKYSVFQVEQNNWMLRSGKCE